MLKEVVYVAPFKLAVFFTNWSNTTWSVFASVEKSYWSAASVLLIQC
jgi:hypothetical protein